MSYEQIKERVWQANLSLQKSGLVVLTWGNASEVDRKSGKVVIKPSGVSYEEMQANDMVVIDLESGKCVEGHLKPSSDTPTHLHLYRKFPDIGGVVHTHSRVATAFAQACRAIPCFGTTHADTFYGTVPCTYPLSAQQIEGDYELQTGVAITEHFRLGKIIPLEMPGVLAANHGPFTWGSDAKQAVKNAIILEEVAQMAQLSLQLEPSLGAIPQVLLDKHFQRKHGPLAYYGQH